MMYIRSASVSVALCEANSMTVLRKLRGQSQEAQAKLLPREVLLFPILRSSNLINIPSRSGYKQAWALEHLLISRWQPKLNFPFVQAIFQRTALGLVSSDLLFGHQTLA